MDNQNGTENGRMAPGVLARISGLQPSLHDAEQKVAELILRDPQAARGCSVTRLADLCGVSPTTIVRFCRTMGFEGYGDFKLALVEELVPQGGALPGPHEDVLPDDDMVELLRKVFSMDTQALASTLETVEVDAFKEAVERLSAARVAVVLGVGSSLPIAMDLHYRFLRSGIHSRFSVDSHIQAVDAAMLEPGDAALAISHSGETRETVVNAELAREAGAATICVTNFPRSPLARACEIRLITSAKRTRWLDDTITARLVQLALFDALCVAVAREKAAEIPPALKRIQKAVLRTRRR